MPISRKKSCRQCRVAKTRCSLSLPCSRCSERSLQCDFEDAFPRFAPYRIRSEASELRHVAQSPRATSNGPEISQQPDLAQIEELIEERIEDINASSLEPEGNFSYDYENPDFMQANDALNIPALDWSPAPSFLACHPPGTFNSSFCGVSPNVISEVIDQPGQSSLPTNPNSPFEHLQAHPRATRQKYHDSQMELSLPNQSMSSAEIERGVAAMIGFDSRKILLPRKTTNAQSFLITQIIWGQIRVYPKLIIEGQLPPFIYPPCVIDDKMPKSCIANGVHSCLPKPLAICASLVSMFYSRTAANSAFVWKSIYSEEERLKQEVLYKLAF